MKPIIRAAVESGRPPLELLLDEPNRKRCKWDGKLIKALYLNEAFDVEGYPIWVEESDAVYFQPRKRVIRSVAVVETAQNSVKKAQPGARYYAEAVLKPGHSWPTREEWLARQNGDAPVFPEDEKAQERLKAAEERAAAKVAANPDVQRIVDDIKAKLQDRAGRLDE